MLKFRGRISFPKLDAAKYTQALEDAVETQMRQAAREWLRAVVPKVPVWAGTSRGSLQPLGRFLRVAIPINPLVQRKGAGPNVGASKSSFKFERIGRRFIFSVSTGVDHFIQNNFYEAPNPPFHLKEPTPWKAFEAGEEAYLKYIKENLTKKIPKIKNFIRYKTIVVG